MIYILCPGCNATGGTELLHQLGSSLCKMGFAASIYYYSHIEGLPLCHPHFLEYNVPIATTILNSSENFIIFPEILANSINKQIARFDKCTPILWWLSVDNANLTDENTKFIINNHTLIHLAQSVYALDYVTKILNIPQERVFYLSDFINSSFLNINTVDVSNRSNDTILFNPRKGFDTTARLIADSGSNLSWRALSKLAPENVPYILSHSKVYIDFGNHPGKDRFPREATCCGCLLITGKKGAAKNDIDINIPAECKFDDNTNTSTIINKLEDMLNNYEHYLSLYEDYIHRTKEEFHTFETDIFNVFHTFTHKIINIASKEYYITNIRNLFNSDSDRITLQNIILTSIENSDFCSAFYYIILYRYIGFEVDNTILTLEIYTRLSFKEYEIAIYLSNQILSDDSQNYEVMMLKSRSLIMSASSNYNSYRIKEALLLIQTAAQLSKGTEDEDSIYQELLYIVSQSKAILSNSDN